MNRTYTPFIRIISVVILFFFSWTFGGLFDIAYAVKNGKPAIENGPKNKEKTAAEKFSEIFKEMEQIVDDTELLACPKSEKLKGKEAAIDDLDRQIRTQFRETEQRLKEAGLSRTILKRHYDFINKYEKNLNKLKSNIAAIGKAQTREALDDAVRAAKEHFQKINPPKKHKPVDPDRLPHRASEPVFKEPRTKPEEFRKEQMAFNDQYLKELPLHPVSPLLEKGGEGGFDSDTILLASNGSLEGLLSQDSNDYHNLVIPAKAGIQGAG